ncbi:(R,R)-butanediol dehydrogenase [Fusarium oxysporum f. sp. albedinis]|nr:(R,R)-butanediol dehydrogenase [Fusarium oxysporum f. sp. albedinis]
MSAHSAFSNSNGVVMMQLGTVLRPGTREATSGAGGGREMPVQERSGTPRNMCVCLIVTPLSPCAQSPLLSGNFRSLSLDRGTTPC